MLQKNNFYNARLLIYENTAIQHIGSILSGYLHLPFLGVHNEFPVQSALKNSVERLLIDLWAIVSKGSWLDYLLF
jgi:hypothetical protein